MVKNRKDCKDVKTVSVFERAEEKRRVADGLCIYINPLDQKSRATQ